MLSRLIQKVYSRARLKKETHYHRTKKLEDLAYILQHNFNEDGRNRIPTFAIRMKMSIGKVIPTQLQKK